MVKPTNRLVKIHIPLLTGETKAQTALILMAREMRIARIQFERIRSNAQLLDDASNPMTSQDREARILTSEEYCDRMAHLFGDIHFLLVSTRIISRLFEMVINDIGEEPELVTLRVRTAPLFKRAAKFRNHLEHIDERVNEGMTDLGNVRGTVFSFNEKRFDYGPTFENALFKFHTDLESDYRAIMKRRGQKPYGVVRSSIKV